MLPGIEYTCCTWLSVIRVCGKLLLLYITAPQLNSVLCVCRRCMSYIRVCVWCSTYVVRWFQVCDAPATNCSSTYFSLRVQLQVGAVLNDLSVPLLDQRMYAHGRMFVDCISNTYTLLCCVEGTPNGKRRNAIRRYCVPLLRTQTCNYSPPGVKLGGVG